MIGMLCFFFLFFYEGQLFNELTNYEFKKSTEENSIPKTRENKMAKLNIEKNCAPLFHPIETLTIHVGSAKIYMSFHLIHSFTFGKPKSCEAKE